MTDEQFSNICHSMLHDIRGRTPRDTGNLADKATLIRSVGSNEMKIYVDEKIAPYFRIVNERPDYYVKSRNSGGRLIRQNRNYMYFQRAVEVAIENLARKIDGEIIK